MLRPKESTSVPTMSHCHVGERAYPKKPKKLNTPPMATACTRPMLSENQPPSGRNTAVASVPTVKNSPTCATVPPKAKIYNGINGCIMLVLILAKMVEYNNTLRSRGSFCHMKGSVS
jgi:hypothetical protein